MVKQTKIKNKKIGKIRKQKLKTRKTKKGGNPNIIPKIIHQIWFGDKMPHWRKELFNEINKVCVRNGYTHKIWSEEDRNETNFPITIAYQNDILKNGIEQEQNRYASVADLARIEIIYHYGGIYLDSIFEITDELLMEIEKINKINKKKFTFFSSNEDPCGLKCANANGEKYLSNSFFAATKKHPILKRLLDFDVLDQIDLEDSNINKTTGPYFLRKGIINPLKDGVYLFETDKIYPFPMSGSVLREPKENTCIIDTTNMIQISENKYLKKNCSPNGALATYNVGLGGTWSK